MDNKLNILNYLAKHHAENYTLHQLSIILKIPYATLYRTIQDMSDLIVMQVKGKAKLVSINWNDTAPAHLAVASYEENKEFLANHIIIKKIAENSSPITLLFGSYAKGTQRKDSDVDLLIITKTGKTNTSFATQEILFRKKINPIVVTEKEFKDMLKEKEENVGKQALKDHIILNGFDKFWRLVYDTR